MAINSEKIEKLDTILLQSRQMERTEKDCIAMYGDTLTAQYRNDFMSTILMKIRDTMT